MGGAVECEAAGGEERGEGDEEVRRVIVPVLIGVASGQ